MKIFKLNIKDSNGTYIMGTADFIILDTQAIKTTEDALFAIDKSMNKWLDSKGIRNRTMQQWGSILLGIPSNFSLCEEAFLDDELKEQFRANGLEYVEKEDIADAAVNRMQIVGANIESVSTASLMRFQMNMMYGCPTEDMSQHYPRTYMMCDQD